jgi:hypothetical protein
MLMLRIEDQMVITRVAIMVAGYIELVSELSRKNVALRRGEMPVPEPELP